MDSEIDPVSDTDITYTAHEWRHRLAEGDMTDAEHEEFLRWLNADLRHEAALDRAVTVWASLAEVAPDLHAARQFTGNDTLPRSGGTLRNWLGHVLQGRAYAVAAGFLAACLSIPLYLWPGEEGAPNGIQRFSSAQGQTLSLQLEDGSAITLGAASEIEVAFDRQSRRIVLLQGAAFCDVAPDDDRPFSVKAAKLNATALGTRFAVKISDKITRVGVEEGRVSVSYPTIIHARPGALRSHRELTAGEQIQASLSAGLGEPAAAVPGTIGAWREHRLEYVAAPLSEVIADANRYSTIPLVLPAGQDAAGTVLVTASFDGRNVDALLSTLEQAFGMQVEREQAQVVIRRRSEAR